MISKKIISVFILSFTCSIVGIAQSADYSRSENGNRVEEPVVSDSNVVVEPELYVPKPAIFGSRKVVEKETTKDNPKRKEKTPATNSFTRTVRYEE